MRLRCAVVALAVSTACTGGPVAPTAVPVSGGLPPSAARIAVRTAAPPVALFSGAFTSLAPQNGTAVEFAVPGPGTVTVTAHSSGTNALALTATLASCESTVAAFAINCSNVAPVVAPAAAAAIAVTFSAAEAQTLKAWVGNLGASAESGTVAVAFTPLAEGGQTLFDAGLTDLGPGLAVPGRFQVPGAGSITVTVEGSGTNRLEVTVTPEACPAAPEALAAACANLSPVDRGLVSPKTLTFDVTAAGAAKVWVANFGSAPESASVTITYRPAS